MRTIERLKREAKEAATWRGHELGKFKRHEWRTSHCATAECSCGAIVTVNSRPMPNEIDICGDAVALNHPI